MKYFYFFLKKFKPLLFILALTLVRCAGPYSYNDDGSTIELSEDDSFQIELQGDIKSDYYWQLVSENTLVKLQKPVTIKTYSDKTLYTFYFKSLSYGEQKIEMIYTDGKDIVNTFQLNVIIGSMGLITSELKK
ncbi:protease inhibitor I42 family protein [Psychroserpens luteus]|uniref:Chagasin family peptidase inhibitor I42 n=1 Tax=Psychroserpens luteus TaxID=1434066 RepID=A0ABW5ZSA5_9FLAO|nr:protease inhibitor I42 family protein [Psychroserpens luteus]